MMAEEIHERLKGLSRAALYRHWLGMLWILACRRAVAWAAYDETAAFAYGELGIPVHEGAD